MCADASKDARFRRTLEELRRLRERRASQNLLEQERGRVQEEVREERRDAHAKTIRGRPAIERRRFRSDVELRAQRDEQMLEWNARFDPRARTRKSKAR
jgi:hypothetical protein